MPCQGHFWTSMAPQPPPPRFSRSKAVCRASSCFAEGSKTRSAANRRRLGPAPSRVLCSECTQAVTSNFRESPRLSLSSSVNVDNILKFERKCADRKKIRSPPRSRKKAKRKLKTLLVSENSKITDRSLLLFNLYSHVEKKKSHGEELSPAKCPLQQFLNSELRENTGKSLSLA